MNRKLAPKKPKHLLLITVTMSSPHLCFVSPPLHRTIVLHFICFAGIISTNSIYNLTTAFIHYNSSHVILANHQLLFVHLFLFVFCSTSGNTHVLWTVQSSKSAYEILPVRVCLHTLLLVSILAEHLTLPRGGHKHSHIAAVRRKDKMQPFTTILKLRITRQKDKN